MKSRATTIGLAMVIALLGTIGIPKQGRALELCVASKEIDIPEGTCVKRATAVLHRYFRDVRPKDEKIFALQGNNATATIVCDNINKGVVFFASSSTNSNTCHENILKIFENF